MCERWSDRKFAQERQWRFGQLLHHLLELERLQTRQVIVRLDWHAQNDAWRISKLHTQTNIRPIAQNRTTNVERRNRGRLNKKESQNLNYIIFFLNVSLYIFGLIMKTKTKIVSLLRNKIKKNKQLTKY